MENNNQDSPDAVVMDPEDFNRQQRFKEIHDARQRVTEFLSEMEIPDVGGGTYQLREATRLAHLVSLYILELEPLIIQSQIDSGDLVSADSLLEFASRMGINPDKEKSAQTPSPQESMQYFSAANRFFAQVGMDLELSEEKGDAGFDYSDILEEGPPDGDVPDIGSDGGTEEGDSDE